MTVPDTIEAPRYKRPAEFAEGGIMKAYAWIAIGSALGGVARHWSAEAAARLVGTTFPWGTLFVNVLGSFAIGLFFTATGPDGRFGPSAETKAFVMVGFCGGFTTFSAFSIQTLCLMQNGEWLRSAANIIGSIVFCLTAVWLGCLAATALNAAR